MKIAKVWTLADVGLTNLIGCGARLYNGSRNFFTLISPHDVKLGTLVIVYESGDIIYRESCPAEAKYLFEKKGSSKTTNDLSYKVTPLDFNGKKSPNLFIPIQDKPFNINNAFAEYKGPYGRNG